MIDTPYDNKMVDNRAGQRFLRLRNVREIPLHGVAPEGEIRTACDENGIPVSREMRRRMIDQDFVPVKRKRPATPKKEKK